MRMRPSKPVLPSTIPLFANRALFETGWFATQTQYTTIEERVPCMPMTASGCVTMVEWDAVRARADGRAHDPPPPLLSCYV